MIASGLISIIEFILGPLLSILLILSKYLETSISAVKFPFFINACTLEMV